jgi:hypothetical protein
MTVFLKKGFTTSCLTCKCHFLRGWGPFPPAGSRWSLGKRLNWVFSLCQGSLSFVWGKELDYELPLGMGQVASLKSPRGFIAHSLSSELEPHDGVVLAFLFCSVSCTDVCFLVSWCVVLTGEIKYSSLHDLKNSGKLRVAFIGCDTGLHLVSLPLLLCFIILKVALYLLETLLQYCQGWVSVSLVSLFFNFCSRSVLLGQLCVSCSYWLQTKLRLLG